MVKIKAAKNRRGEGRGLEGRKHWAGVSGVRDCPGLIRSSGRLAFHDAAGIETDLFTAGRLSLNDTARAMGKSYSYARMEIGRGRLYPVLLQNGRVMEVFACAVADWKARRVMRRGPLE